MIIKFLKAYLRHTLKSGAPRFRLKVGNAGCMWRLIGWPPKKPIKKHNCRLQRACTRCLIDSDVDCRTPATAVRDHQQAGREAGYPGRPVRLNRIIGEPDWRTEAGSLKHQLAAIHVDACAKSLQDRGSTPLASTLRWPHDASALADILILRISEDDLAQNEEGLPEHTWFAGV